MAAASLRLISQKNCDIEVRKPISLADFYTCIEKSARQNRFVAFGKIILKNWWSVTRILSCGSKLSPMKRTPTTSRFPGGKLLANEINVSN